MSCRVDSNHWAQIQNENELKFLTRRLIHHDYQWFHTRT